MRMDHARVLLKATGQHGAHIAEFQLAHCSRPTHFCAGVLGAAASSSGLSSLDIVVIAVTSRVLRYTWK
jgi:hypothetical protein